MLKIRLLRTGRRHATLFRLVVTDARVKRQGRYLENVGHYDPAGKDETKLTINADRIKHWFSLGAQPTESAANLLKNKGINYYADLAKAAADRKRKAAKAKPKAAAAAPKKK